MRGRWAFVNVPNANIFHVDPGGILRAHGKNGERQMTKIAKKFDPTTPIKTVFSCQSPEARAVFLSGTFNDWDPSAAPMERQEDGSWRAQLGLAPGKYEYKFVVDGVWWAPSGEGCVTNPFGTLNCTIEVPKAAVPRRAKAGA